MELGVIIRLSDHTEQELAQLCEMGFHACQLNCWNPDLYTEQVAMQLKAMLQKYGIHISTLWCGWKGPAVWNFYEGQKTLGLVPEQYRAQREMELMRGSDFGAMLGVTQIATHVGFIPEQPTSAEFHSLVCAIRYVANYCRENGQSFLFETGQETPVTLLRVIEELDTDNVGINMDTANLILYGKANSADAVTVFGKYVMDTHIKDGFYPTDGKHLGKEVKVGDGLANIPEVVKRLRAVNYTGNYIIEREIKGEQQQKDIVETLAYLKTVLQ